MNIKAIQTRYQGYKFRSRLEARWGVFFDALGIRWEYEKEGYELPSGRYLPDFWLPQVQMWAEVKPVEFSVLEKLKATELSVATGFPVLQLVGTPENKPYLAIEHETRAVEVEYCLTCYHGYPQEEGRFYSWPGDDEDGRHDDTARAVEAARSARFEYGESGAA
jgi:hypothetical protein